MPWVKNRQHNVPGFFGRSESSGRTWPIQKTPSKPRLDRHVAENDDQDAIQKFGHAQNRDQDVDSSDFELHADQIAVYKSERWFI